MGRAESIELYLATGRYSTGLTWAAMAVSGEARRSYAGSDADNRSSIEVGVAGLCQVLEGLRWSLAVRIVVVDRALARVLCDPDASDLPRDLAARLVGATEPHRITLELRPKEDPGEDMREVITHSTLRVIGTDADGQPWYQTPSLF